MLIYIYKDIYKNEKEILKYFTTFISVLQFFFFFWGGWILRKLVFVLKKGKVKQVTGFKKLLFLEVEN